MEKNKYTKRKKNQEIKILHFSQSLLCFINVSFWKNKGGIKENFLNSKCEEKQENERENVSALPTMDVDKLTFLNGNFQPPVKT